MHWICVDEGTCDKLLIHVDDIGEELSAVNTRDEVHDFVKNMT